VTRGAAAPPSEASNTQGEPQDSRGWGPAVRGERYAGRAAGPAGLGPRRPRRAIH